MSAYKDMRRSDLSKTSLPIGRRSAAQTRLTTIAVAVVPYQEPVTKGDNVDFSSTMSSTLPMAAIFMRNRFVGWYEDLLGNALSLVDALLDREQLSWWRDRMLTADTLQPTTGLLWCSASKPG